MGEIGPETALLLDAHLGRFDRLRAAIDDFRGVFAPPAVRRLLDAAEAHVARPEDPEAEAALERAVRDLCAERGRETAPRSVDYPGEIGDAWSGRVDLCG